ncbi:MAG: hypothetical protein ACKOWF_14840, partial [Chloroflexota bacterium]
EPGVTTRAPAVRLSGGGEKKDRQNKDERTPEPEPAQEATAAPAEPTPTWGGGVRDVTPNPEVTGG